MAVFKCKMCGGALEISEGMTVCECDYCGTTQTLPKTNNEQHLNLINRANHFRQQCEFDKAAEIYEKIAAQSDGDAEIYWSLVLCRYGIEYVDDPATKKKIPTCHRTQFRSILDDPDYQSVLQYADMMQRNVYQSEAEYIDKVQKSILEISNKEKPFDIFICYKETDENGRRTPDSVLAQELYYGLVQEGFKVFFSRITLESKLGTEYEPYIFAALNSAKVMVVVGTKPEYFNAVWVKNEWSRYLMLMQEDRKRTLIPAYKDMDPYDLPDALSMFQAQDMSKLGFMQDLIRGIRKIAKNEPEVTERPVVQQTVVHTAASSNIENLLKRGYLSLEDYEWDEAKRFFDAVLNENVEEYRAYIGLLCVEYECSDESRLAEVQSSKDNDLSPFIKSNYYIKACRFGGEEIEKRLYEYYLQGNYEKADIMLCRATTVQQVSEVQEMFNELGDYLDSPAKLQECEELKLEIRYDNAVRTLNDAHTENDCANARTAFASLGDYLDSPAKIQECEELKLKIRYNDAVRALNNAHTENECIGARNAFVSLGDYNDSQQKIQECNEKIEYIEKDNIYNEAKNLLNGYAEDVNKAITIFESISDFKDSVSMIQKCRDRLEEFAEAERKRKAEAKRKKVKAVKGAVASVVVVAAIVTGISIGKLIKYNKAVSLYENSNYQDAYVLFEQLGSYKDSKEYMKKYDMVITLSEVGDEVEFGKYQWYIIEKNDHGIKLLCKDIVCNSEYNGKVSDDNVRWEHCYIRKWLNNEFYNEFKDEEKSMITETICNIENDTKDKVFLLSPDEANKLSMEILSCGTWWWLRSPSPYNSHYVWCVHSDGYFGSSYAVSSGGVRPALTLKF